MRTDRRYSAKLITCLAAVYVGVSILTLPGGSFCDPKTLAEPETL
jgi:hypothetical protein